MRNIEVLAPAGSYEAFCMAINAGADAVYLGGEIFGARAFAKNLSVDEIKKAIDYAHIRNRKVYLTVNTLLKDNEIKEKLYDYILKLYEHGLDAVIVQDYGVLAFVLENFKELNVHASTQMGVMGNCTIKKLEEMGVKRVVLPREATLEKISDIKNNSDIEIEAFVHGALCYCFSGQCLLSSFIGGRSGNRGRCAQPCRQVYDVISRGKVINNSNEKYIISPKDMCTLDILPKIIESGVMSLKIEGRMKKPEYTATITSIYKKYVDLYEKYGKDNFKIEESDKKKLFDIFNRNGFNRSYYEGKTGRSMITLKKPAFREENRELIESIRDEFTKSVKVGISGKVSVKKNEPVSLFLKTNDNRFSCNVQGLVPDIAKNKGIDETSIKKHIEKMGTTSFVCGNLECDIENGLFLTVGTIKELRRNATELLEKQICDSYRRNISNLNKINAVETKKTKQPVSPTLRCKVENIEQAVYIINTQKADIVYLNYECFSETKQLLKLVEDAHKNGVLVYFACPHIFDNEILGNNLQERNAFQFADGFLARNIEQYFYLENKTDKPVVLDYNIYSFNNIAGEFLKKYNVENITIPMELSRHERKKLYNDYSEEVVYGYIPSMITKNCIYKTCNMCGDKASLSLRDSHGYSFDVKKFCDICYNIIYNSVPICLFEFIDDIDKYVKHFRLEFTNETNDEIEKIFKSYNKRVSINNATKGHFIRGVD